MSASAPQLPGAIPDITYITSEPFEPKPLIADILRTRFCVPDSVFLVEGVDTAHTAESKRWRVVRLMLGDGELCIQALLSAEMHRLIDRGEILFGSYVKLQQFRVEWRDVAKAGSNLPRKHGDSGHPSEEKTQMVYLIVDSLVVVGWHNTLADTSIARGPDIHADAVELESEVDEDPRVQVQSIGPQQIQPPCQTGVETKEDREQADPEDDFEVMAVSEDKAAYNRQEVATAIVSHEQDIGTTSGSPGGPSNGPLRPLKLAKLRSIPNLPYKQNWSVNVLCVISAISDVEPAGIPPYTQRQARLADPSTDKHVLLTVFLDPHLFNPGVGSVVLLIGVKNHRFDGGSLKKYASDRPVSGENWWYENPTQFDWCDVDEIHQWWEHTGMQT
ncbi:putative cyclin-like f-box [Rosellinia necatrix]|uniref:Putative cyclin-like f-box n=1 Tax=Rosellinia necatrix TaxID=77044 RepID=A0A1S7ULF7_ROSNE|nr:putative cyclin-like f-box [Rosellinia necatrix]